MSSTAPQRRTTPTRARSAPQTPATALGRARLAVVPRLRSRAPRVPFVMLVSLLLLGGVIGLLLFNTSMQQASFDAQRLQDESEALAAREQALTTQLEELRNPDRLSRLACDRGMVVGENAVFLDARTGRLTGTPVPAARPEVPCVGTGSSLALEGGTR